MKTPEQITPKVEYGEDGMTITFPDGSVGGADMFNKIEPFYGTQALIIEVYGTFSIKAPEGYELTDELRKPLGEDWYLTNNLQRAFLAKDDPSAEGIGGGRRIILKKL